MLAVLAGFFNSAYLGFELKLAKWNKFRFDKIYWIKWYEFVFVSHSVFDGDPFVFCSLLRHYESLKHLVTLTVVLYVSCLICDIDWDMWKILLGGKVLHWNLLERMSNLNCLYTIYFFAQPQFEMCLQWVTNLIKVRTIWY